MSSKIIHFKNKEGRTLSVNSMRIVYVAGPQPASDPDDHGFVILEGYVEHPILLGPDALDKLAIAISQYQELPSYLFFDMQGPRPQDLE